MPRAAWPPYRTLRGREHAHVGRVGVILGGGPSVAAALTRAPPGALYVSVNDHGVRLLKDSGDTVRRCSYIVACDKIEERARADVGLPDGPPRDGLPWMLPVVSRHMWGDYRMLHRPGDSSGMAAAWLARFFGCSPIILTGMDCYSGATYFDVPGAQSTGYVITDHEHLSRWKEFFKRYPAMYRCIGCHKELQAICGTFAEDEPAQPAVSKEKLAQELGGVWCETTRETMIGTRIFPAATRLELSRIEAENLHKKRQLRRLRHDEVPAIELQR